MLTRIAMVTASASLVLLFGVSKDALACHRGDPHGSATSCDGGGGVDLTNFVMVDANGDVVGPVLSFDLNPALPSPEDQVHVIISTPNQGQIILSVYLPDLRNNEGFHLPRGGWLYFENPGCSESDTAYLSNRFAVPNVFPEVGFILGTITPTRELWIGTSIAPQLDRVFFSRRRDGGVCDELDPQISGPYYPAEQLTDEDGLPVDDINVLYPPPLRIEVQ